jgi:hypothetical protein
MAIEPPCLVIIVPYTVTKLVTKAACTSETPQPTRSPSGSQIPAEWAF